MKRLEYIKPWHIKTGWRHIFRIGYILQLKWKILKGLKLISRNTIVACHLQLSRRYSEGKLDDWADGHADRRRRVHLVPHSVAVNLQREAQNVSMAHTRTDCEQMSQTGVAGKQPHPNSSTGKHSVHLLADRAWNSQPEVKGFLWVVVASSPAAIGWIITANYSDGDVNSTEC